MSKKNVFHLNISLVVTFIYHISEFLLSSVLEKIVFFFFSRTTNMTSIEQQLNLVVVAQPINAIKDADILERLWKGFEDQLWVSESD